jgi:allantoate deiminase
MGNGRMMSKLGQTVSNLLDQAARHSEPGVGVTRLFLTEEHRQIVATVRRWMQAAGMETRLDDAGTLVGTVRGASRDSSVLILGSHVDSVRHGGKFDGMLGVLLPIACMNELRTRGVRLPYTIEIAAFGDEEGVRFPTTLLGSRAFAGLVADRDLDVVDVTGVRLRDALQRFGCDPSAIQRIARDRSQILGFVEVHIEQGPVLESARLPVGCVTTIAGIERHELIMRGNAGHAGTTPMAVRRDALVGAAEFILEVDRLCRSTNDLVGTVGMVLAEPNAINVIPGTVRMAFELRSPRRATRIAARLQLRAAAERIAHARGLLLEFRRNYERDGVECASRLVEALSSAIERCGHEPLRLNSGAGHDGLAMASLCDVGMLFIRCKNGLSHHPDELATPDDIGAAGTVLIEFLTTFTAEAPVVSVR